MSGVKFRLNSDNYALVDADDLPSIVGQRWYMKISGKTGYAITTLDDGSKLRMHRLIMKDHLTDEKNFVDHINGDGLDNRKINLRVCTHMENRRNTRIKRKFKGILKDYRAKSKPYYARITVNGKTKYIGKYDTDIEAAKAYDKKAKELFKEFAKLNFPEAS